MSAEQPVTLIRKDGTVEERDVPGMPAGVESLWIAGNDACFMRRMLAVGRPGMIVYTEEGTTGEAMGRAVSFITSRQA